MGKRPHKARLTHRISYEIAYRDAFDDKKTLGECDYERTQIRLLRSLPEKRRRSVLLHEILHALSYVYEIGLTENQVEKLELALIRFERLNKGWVK